MKKGEEGKKNLTLFTIQLENRDHACLLYVNNEANFSNPG